MKKIGVLMYWKEKTKGRFYNISPDYFHRLEELWVFPVMIPCDTKNVAYYLKDCSGFLLPGGPDICPDLYEAPHKWARNFNVELDKYSLSALSQAMKLKLPVLGICRGMQLLNIYLWGSLIQDIKTHKKHHQYEHRYKEVHRVKILKETFLHKVFKSHSIGVNSVHHQAIKILWKWLTISAFDEEDERIIEAVENREKLIFGVQWHPEKLPHHNSLIAHAFAIKKSKK